MCTIEDIRAIKQESWPYDDNPDLINVDLEFFTVDDLGRQVSYDGHRDFDTDLADHTPDDQMGEYWCFQCEASLDTWSAVEMHIEAVAQVTGWWRGVGI